MNIILFTAAADDKKNDVIKWVEFDTPYKVLEKALKADIDSYQNAIGKSTVPWVDVLSYLACKYGNDWKKYKSIHMDDIIKKLKNGEKIADITKDMKYFDYYYECYEAILGNFVGEYRIGTGEYDESGNPVIETRYGLKSYSPIAHGFGYNHYDDFGNSRSYGFKRRHLGNDLVGNTGTPIIAVESGIIENIGWNKYGGWRIGIRSLDKKRFYYYAHLRKNSPYAYGMSEGVLVQAGDIIGYLGMTGYSNKEDFNGMTLPHLHFGMQLIFEEWQKECDNEIWINVYHLVDLLKKHTSPVIKSEQKGYIRKYPFSDPTVEKYLNVPYNEIIEKYKEG